MYRRCIFCSSDLGANEVFEEFPVGRTVAFDAARGRLWAVCPRCERWNLAPLEERWEPVESAERLFRDARLRVQSENVGLARLADGTRLVRVGQALPGELAAWRYGSQMPGRWRRYVARESTAILGTLGLGVAVAGGAVALGIVGGSFTGAAFAWTLTTALNARGRRRARQPIVHLPAELSPDGEAHLLRRHELGRLTLAPDEGDGVEVRLDQWQALPWDVGQWVLGRAMVDINDKGGSRLHVDRAVALLAESGSAQGYLRRYATGGLRREDYDGQQRHPAEARLALEMALHEESERVAMEGELAALRAAWREAEEIARIADALPGEPLPPLPPGG